jgi:hypothetical protein
MVLFCLRSGEEETDIICTPEAAVAAAGAAAVGARARRGCVRG